MNVVTGTRTSKVIAALGWAMIVLSIIVLFVFAAIRLSDMTKGAAVTDAFGARYVEHPWTALIHIVPGLLFLAFAPFQFIPQIRRRLSVHRRLGWFLVPCAAASGLFALVAAVQFPAFGGLITQAATAFFGLIFLFSLGKAVYHIRRKEVRLHREWMIRLFALGLGVATIRLVIGLSQAFTDISFEDGFGPAFWLGLGTNWLVAEAWIHYTRRSVRIPRTGQ